MRAASACGAAGVVTNGLRGCIGNDRGPLFLDAGMAERRVDSCGGWRPGDFRNGRGPGGLLSIALLLLTIAAAGCHEYRGCRFQGISVEELGAVVSQEACFRTWSLVAPGSFTEDELKRREVIWSSGFRERLAEGRSGWFHWRRRGDFFVSSYHCIDHIKLDSVEGGTMLSIYCEEAHTAFPDSPAFFYERAGDRELRMYGSILARVARDYPGVTVSAVGDWSLEEVNGPCTAR